MEHITLVIPQFSRLLNQSPPNVDTILRDIKCNEDQLNENKNSSFNEQESIMVKHEEVSKTIDESMEEEELIEIEREWLKLNGKVHELGLKTDVGSETDSDSLEDDDIKQSHPIQNVLQPALLRSILLRSAVDARKVSPIPIYHSVAHNTPHNRNIQPSFIQSHGRTSLNLKKSVINDHSSKAAVKVEQCKKNIAELGQLEVNPTEKFSRRKQKSRIQSIIKNIENELEEDIGNGYGDTEWCREFTQLHKHRKTVMANARERQTSTDSTNEGRPSSTICIPTPSWRIIDEYDYHESDCGDHESDSDIDKSESNHSDDSNESDSSTSSNSTWVPPDTISEYVFPNNNTCDMKVEIRLINLTGIQIQALRKKIKYGISTPNCTNVPLSVTQGTKMRSIECQNYRESYAREEECMTTRRSSRYTRAKPLHSPKRNKEEFYIAESPEISQSCLKELARLKFSNAGPKIKITTNRKNISIQRMQQSAEEHKTGLPACKTKTTEQNELVDKESPISTKVIESGNNDANLTLKKGKKKLHKDPLFKDQETGILMEDYNIDEIKVILADDDHNSLQISDGHEHIASNKVSDESLQESNQTYTGCTEIFEDNLDVIMSYVSSDTDDDN